MLYTLVQSLYPCAVSLLYFRLRAADFVPPGIVLSCRFLNGDDQIAKYRFGLTSLLISPVT